MNAFHLLIAFAIWKGPCPCFSFRGPPPTSTPRITAKRREALRVKSKEEENFHPQTTFPTARLNSDQVEVNGPVFRMRGEQDAH